MAAEPALTTSTFFWRWPRTLVPCTTSVGGLGWAGRQAGRLAGASSRLARQPRAEAGRSCFLPSVHPLYRGRDARGGRALCGPQLQHAPGHGGGRGGPPGEHAEVSEARRQPWAWGHACTEPACAPPPPPTRPCSSPLRCLFLDLPQQPGVGLWQGSRAGRCCAGAGGGVHSLPPRAPACELGEGGPSAAAQGGVRAG